jgi:hypothetical protein
MAVATAIEQPLTELEAAGSWHMAPAQRRPVLLEAIAEAHAWHYERHPAYRRLVNGTSHYDPALGCARGHDTPYLVNGTIRRIDLLEEAGCAGQL